MDILMYKGVSVRALETERLKPCVGGCLYGAGLHLKSRQLLPGQHSRRLSGMTLR